MAIYLDNAATTKMDSELLETIQSFSCCDFYNPSAGYKQAIKNSHHLDSARDIILEKLGGTKGDIIFTSGATESNNLAIRGSLREGKWEYIFSVGEHPSVYNVAKMLQQEGKIVHFVGLNKNGEIDYDQLASLITEKTRLVSAMLVSNETGAVNDIPKISQIVKSKNPKTLIHVDGVQGFCKIPFSLQNCDIDFFTISGHKFHAPKGVGCLYIKNKASLKSLVYGGGQEFAVRSGTENLPSIMAMAERVKKVNIRENLDKVLTLREGFLNKISDKNVSVVCGGSPYICSLSFKGVNGETLMRALEDEVIVGTGSACSTKKAGNRILEAMGFSKDYIKSSIRVSFNSYQTIDEVEKAGEIILKKYYEILEKVK